MLKLKTVATARIEQPYYDMLAQYCDIKVTGWAVTDRIWSEEEIFPQLKGAEVLIIGYEKLTKEMLERLPELKLIACCRSSPVNIDVQAARELGIPVIHTPGRNANAVAEFTLGLMLDISRNIGRACREIKMGRYLGQPMSNTSTCDSEDIIWELPDANVYAIYKGFDLAGKTLGVIGYGLIGRLVAQKAAALGMNILVYDPYLAASPDDAAQVSLEQLLEQSDFVSLHCKESKDTKGMLGQQQFKIMKNTAYIINTARASMISQEALLQALECGEIGGAALDVFWTEPLPCDHPLLSMDNVIITPHIAGSSYDVPVFQSKMITEDILTWIKGGSPKRVCLP